MFDGVRTRSDQENHKKAWIRYLNTSRLVTAIFEVRMNKLCARHFWLTGGQSRFPGEAPSTVNMFDLYTMGVTELKHSEP